MIATPLPPTPPPEAVRPVRTRALESLLQSNKRQQSGLQSVGGCQKTRAVRRDGVRCPRSGPRLNTSYIHSCCLPRISRKCSVSVWLSVWSWSCVPPGSHRKWLFLHNRGTTADMKSVWDGKSEGGGGRGGPIGRPWGQLTEIWKVLLVLITAVLLWLTAQIRLLSVGARTHTHTGEGARARPRTPVHDFMQKYSQQPQRSDTHSGAQWSPSEQNQQLWLIRVFAERRSFPQETRFFYRLLNFFLFWRVICFDERNHSFLLFSHQVNNLLTCFLNSCFELQGSFRSVSTTKTSNFLWLSKSVRIISDSCI